ncbi:MAG: hypothetical protein AAEJ57_02830, partial [Opitutales bacterium]
QSKNGFPEIIPKERGHGLGELKAPEEQESQENKKDREKDPGAQLEFHGSRLSRSHFITLE